MTVFGGSLVEGANTTSDAEIDDVGAGVQLTGVSGSSPGLRGGST